MIKEPALSNRSDICPLELEHKNEMHPKDLVLTAGQLTPTTNFML